MGKEEHEEKMAICPVGRFFLDLEMFLKGRSSFSKHMNQARIEFLKAVRSLVDERISQLEKNQEAVKQKKATRIKVQ